jgi:hypothetical protein
VNAAPAPAPPDSLAAPRPASSTFGVRSLNSSAISRAFGITAVLAVGVALLLLQYRSYVDGYMTDDAFISFRYARNLADGLGPVWQSGTSVEGYTNFGWILLIAGAMKIGVEPIDSSRVFGALASGAVLVMMPLLVAQLRPAWSAGWWIATVAAVFALGINPGFALWTFAGLETPGVTALVIAAITAHLHEERTQRAPLLSSPLFVAAALVRPDAIVFWAITGAFKALRLTEARSRADVVSTLRQLVVWGLLFAAPFGIYWLWRWSYYGDFFPNTYYLKSEHSRQMLERGWEYTFDFIRTYWLWLLAIAVVPAWRELRRPHRPTIYILALIVCWSAYVVDSGGDWMPHFRFFIPALPLIYVAIAHGAIDVGETLARRAGDGAPRAAATTALALLVVGGVTAASFSPTDNREAENPAEFVEHPEILPGGVDGVAHRKIGEWLRDNLPPDFTVAQIATGIVPYYSELPTLDMLGVNDRHIARRDIPLGYGAAGHEKEDGGYVISLRPEVIWLGLALEEVPRSTPEEYMPPRYKEWVPVKTNITTNAYIWLLYRPVAVEMEGGWLNLLVRHDVDIPALPAPPR